MYVVFPAQSVCAVQLYPRDEDCGKVRAARSLQEARCHVELVVAGYEDACFVEEWVVGGSSCGEEERVRG